MYIKLKDGSLYWLGSVTSELHYWVDRALRAEKKVKENDRQDKEGNRSGAGGGTH